MKPYKRVLVKLSGAAVAGGSGFGFDNDSLSGIVDELLALVERGVQMGVVIGGGNIMRGNTASYWGIDRVEADNIGMLGTVLNSLMLRGALTSRLTAGQQVRVMTSLPIAAVAEPFIRLKAVKHLDKGHIVIFAGGNGQPFVTTDYPSVQRALETECEAVLVAKNGTDGVYDKDPNIYKDAVKHERLTYDEVIRGDLRVMDPSAFILARDHNLPIHVFDITEKGALVALCQGESVGTKIGSAASF
ncbi:UMP kinase [soil metagenome]